MKLAEGISYVLSVVFSQAALLLQFIKVDKLEETDKGSLKMGPGQQEYSDDKFGPSLMEILAPYIYWGMASLIIGVALFLRFDFLPERRNGQILLMSIRRYPMQNWPAGPTKTPVLGRTSGNGCSRDRPIQYASLFLISNILPQNKDTGENHLKRLKNGSAG